MKTVAVVELGLYERMVPLVGGYLEAFARTDPTVRQAYRFAKYATTAKVGRDALVRAVAELQADVYAFSCYVWNARLISSVVAELTSARPGVQIMLGGPQVMHRANRYLNPAQSNVAICNGEGEVTFSEYLRELTEARPNMSRVAGISFCREGQIVTTSPRSRLTSMDEIPSPFLGGLFDGEFSTTVFETNRGCPFRCGFCFWGAATNDRVYRFSEDRVKEEIDWIGKSGIVFVYIADANWGMQERDIDLSHRFADSRMKRGAPRMVYYSAAKNSPDRVTEVTRIFRKAGIVASQPVSLQTMDDQVLSLVDRSNIKKSAYQQVQDQLSSQGISSFTELIWPLPGESVESFCLGIEQLCRSGASTIIVYPHLLLPNTPLHKRREEFGFITVAVDDGAGEAEIVVGTAQTSRDQFEEGMRLFYAVHLLHNARALHSVLRYLDRTGTSSYGTTFAEFARFWRTTDYFPLVDFVEESVRTLACYDLFNYGKFIHYALHAFRSSTEELVRQFISSRPYWADENVRFLYEIDRVLTPYVYSSTSAAIETIPFEVIEVTPAGPHAFEIAIPDRHLMAVADVTLLGRETAASGYPGRRPRRHRVDHAQQQHPYMKAQGLEHNAGYCHGIILRVENMLPACHPL